MKDFSSFKDSAHYPVMLKEVMKICSPEKGGLFLDCTFGCGGYSNAILSFPKTRVIAIDRDSQTKKYAMQTEKNFKNRFTFHNIKFSELNKSIGENTKLDYIIFDLGLSSLQILDLKRGFSFNSKNKLDMGMGINSLTAHQVINSFDLKTLTNILRFFGEEEASYKIAKNIIKKRNTGQIKLTTDLVNIIKSSKKKNFKKKINISTKTFQALRIFVNKEISELIEGLIKASKFLKLGGKIVVVSFHSIEDKIVKFFFTNFSNNKPKLSRYFPETKVEKTLFKNYSNKIIRPTQKEIEINNASRSAKLRFAVRNKEEFFYPKNFKDRFSHYLELENSHV